MNRGVGGRKIGSFLSSKMSDDLVELHRRFRETSSRQQRLANPALSGTAPMPVPMTSELFAPVGSTTGDTTARTFIIVDTNVLLARRELIESLAAAQQVHENDGLTLIVPWVVVQELDAMKNDASATLHVPARDAIQFLHDALARRDGRFRGQRVNEFHAYAVVGSALGLHVCVCFSEGILNSKQDNDDRVLDCCLYYQQLGAGTQLVLLSDDRNLCVKAMVHGVLTVSAWRGSALELCQHIRAVSCAGKIAGPSMYARRSSDLEMVPTRHGSTLTHISAHVSISHAGPLPRMSTPPPSAHATPLPSSPNTLPLFESPKASQADVHADAAQRQLFLAYVVDSLLTTLARKLPPALQLHLESALGVYYLDLIRRQPPWSLLDCLFLIRTHWIAVFREAYRRERRVSDLACPALERMVGNEWRARGGRWFDEKTADVRAESPAPPTLQWRASAVHEFVCHCEAMLAVCDGAVDPLEERRRRDAVIDAWKRRLADMRQEEESRAATSTAVEHTVDMMLD